MAALTLEVREVRLLVVGSLAQTERVDNVEDGLGLVVDVVAAAILSRRVGTNVFVSSAAGPVLLGIPRLTNVLSTDGDLPAVGLVGDTVNLLEVVRVGDELVAGDDVLRVGLAWQSGAKLRMFLEAPGTSAARAAHLVNDHFGGWWEETADSRRRGCRGRGRGKVGK